MRRDPKLEWFDLPCLTVPIVARVLNLQPETVLALSKKGCLNPERSTEGRMIFRTAEIIRWERETSR